MLAKNRKTVSKGCATVFDVGPMEFAVIIVVALLVVGPERIPEIARTLGRFIGQLRQLGGDIGDPIQQVREALHEGIQEGEAIAHQIQADVEGVHEDLQSAADLANDPAVAEQPAAAQPATVQLAAAPGVAAPVPDPAAAALQDTAREAAAVIAASSADTAPHDDDLGNVDLPDAAVPTDTPAVDELDPVQQAIASIEANEDYAPVEPEAAAEETSDGTAAVTDAADDDEVDPVQQAIAAIEANEEYAPVEPEATEPETSDTAADTDDDDSYDPVLDTLARKVGDLPQDTDDAAVSVGPSEEPDLPAEEATSKDDDTPAVAASSQEAPAAADADTIPETDGEGEATKSPVASKAALSSHADGVAATTTDNADVPLYTEVALPTTPTEAGDAPDRAPADGLADSGTTASAPDGLPAEATRSAAPTSGLIAAGEAVGGADSNAAAVAVAEEDAVRVALEPALYEALQGMDIAPEERARELIVLGLFREGRMTAGRAAWHLGLSEQEFTDLLAYKGISLT